MSYHRMRTLIWIGALALLVLALGACAAPVAAPAADAPAADAPAEAATEAPAAEAPAAEAAATEAPAEEAAAEEAPAAEVPAPEAAPTVAVEIDPNRVQVRWFVGLGTGTDPQQQEVQNAVVEEFNNSQDKIQLIMEVVPYNGARDALCGAGPP